jgi:hypothetical protein
MKYIFFLLIFFNIIYSKEITEYHDSLEYEQGEICKKIIENGKICKKKIMSSIKYTDIQNYNREDYIIKIENEKNSIELSLFVRKDKRREEIKIPLEVVSKNLYKGLKQIEKIDYSYDFNNLGKVKSEKKNYYDIYVEFLNDKEYLKLYMIDGKFYLEKRYEIIFE